MALLEIRFTLKNEDSETIFQLVQNDDKLELKGHSICSGEKVVPIWHNKETNTLELKRDDVFVEDEETIKERLLSLTSEWLEAKSEGMEINDDFSEQAKEKPGYGPDEIYVENKPFSISTLIELIRDGDLEVLPEFQRHFIWDRTRQSKLIESILLGLPLPAIYLSQYDDGRLTIVDGLQRISTIQRFMDDKLILCNMEYFTKCNGKKYSELKGILPLLRYRKFRQTQIMCFVIDYRSPNALKYDLFRRLNSGGKSLNDQEIRNCLSRQKLRNLLFKMINSEEFKKATNNSVRDTRMGAQESALRFMYFYDQYNAKPPIGDYNGEMGRTLDRYVEHLNACSEQELNRYLDVFKRSMKVAYDLFGEYAFRKVDLENNKKYSVNKSLMLAISVLLACHYEDNQLYNSGEINFTQKLADLLRSDTKLTKMITTSTTHKASISYTIETLKSKLFDKYLF